MKILDLLAKLGILRFGAKTGVYHSARDRPVEFMMDDVMSAKRDLVTEDESKIVEDQDK